MTYTEAEVLGHHGIALAASTPDQRTDAARAAGLISACLGCGSVQGIDVTADLGAHPTVEAARVATRDSLGLGETDCCPDADTIVY